MASPASAAIRISHDPGGRMGHYYAKLSNMRSSGEQIVIDGPCLSACTMLLGMIPKERICVTRRAQLGFHAAWRPDEMGRPVTSVAGTQALWDIYPPEVRGWLTRRGGLRKQMVFLRGRELASMYNPCR